MTDPYTGFKPACLEFLDELFSLVLIPNGFKTSVFKRIKPLWFRKWLRHDHHFLLRLP